MGCHISAACTAQRPDQGHGGGLSSVSAGEDKLVLVRQGG